MNDRLEDRIRAALQARADTTVIHPMVRFEPARHRRSWAPRDGVAGVVGVAGLGLAAAAVIVAVVVTADDGPRTVVAGPSATTDRAEGSDDEGGAGDADTDAAPLLGPLPYLVLDLPGATATSAEALTGPAPDAPDVGADGWHVQQFEAGPSVDLPRVQVLTVPYLDADGPDDIGSTYQPSVTEAVTVQGEPARLLVDGDFAGIWWPGGGDGGVLLTSWRVSRDELLRSADGLVPRADGGAGGWDAGYLPGPMAATVDAPRGGDAVTPWWTANLHYRLPSGAQLSLSVSTGGRVAYAERVGPQPGGALEAVMVAGRPGVLVTVAAEPTDHRLLWRPSDTTIAELWASGASRDEVLAAAEAVREVDEPAWRTTLPDDALDPAEQTALVAELGTGTPLPDGTGWEGFLAIDATTSPSADSVIVSEQQYVFRMAHHAACAWQSAWAAAMDAGDSAAAADAVVQLESSAGWAATQAMAAEMAASGSAVDPEALVVWDREAIGRGDVDAVRDPSAGFC